MGIVAAFIFFVLNKAMPADLLVFTVVTAILAMMPYCLPVVMIMAVKANYFQHCCHNRPVALTNCHFFAVGMQLAKLSVKAGRPKATARLTRPTPAR